jgi:hypothetical protein
LLPGVGDDNGEPKFPVEISTDGAGDAECDTREPDVQQAATAAASPIKKMNLVNLYTFIVIPSY